MNEATIDIWDCINMLKRRYVLILSILSVAVIMGVVAGSVSTPIYQAETVVRIKQPVRGITESMMQSFSSDNPKQVMMTYSEIIKSRPVVEAVIEQMQMSMQKRLTYETIVGQISTQPVKETDILKVRVQSESSADAQLVANKLVDVFIARLAALERKDQGLVKGFIGERLQESKKELEIAENALELYKRTQRAVAPDVESQILVERLSSVNRLVAENTVNLATAEARLSSFQQQIKQEVPAAIADSILIQQYKAKLVDLEVDLAGKLQSYSEKHPKVIGLRATISDTKRKLDAEVTRVIGAEGASINPVYQSLMQGKVLAEADRAAALAQRQAVDRIRAENEKILMAVPTRQQGLARLMRDAAVAQEIYVMLAKRFEEARINEIMIPTDIQIIEPATVPDWPIKPRKTFMVLAAAFLGLLIGTGVAFGLEFMNQKIREAGEAEKWLELPVLGSIPVYSGIGFNQTSQGVWGNVKGLITSKSGRER